MTRNLQRALEQQKRQTEPYNQEITGLLGIPLGGQKRVEVPNRNGYVFVRLRDNQSEVIQAYNNKVATSYGLPVILQREGNKYVVVGFDSRKYENNLASQSAFVPRHGNAHSFDSESGGGGDIVWVYPRQFMPSLVIPSGSVGAGDVIVNSYILRKDDGTWKYTGNTGTASLLPYRPTSPTGAVMALVYLDALTGNPGFLINSGTVFLNSITGSSQIAPFIPQATGSSVIPLAAIRLITGTSKISWDNIYDVRQFLHTTPTGSAGGGGGITDAASDSKNYGRRNAAWVDLDSYYLKIDASNDPLTGQLTIAPGNAGGGVYIVIGATGSFSNYNAVFLNRKNSSSFQKYAIQVNDDEVYSRYNYIAGLLLHQDYNGDTLVDINPYTDPAATLAIINSANTMTTGTLLSLRSAGVEKFSVAGDGNMYIGKSPVGRDLPFATYVNLNPITASGQFPYSATVYASMVFLSWSMAVFTAGTAHDASNYYTLNLVLRQTSGDTTIATLNTKTLGSITAGLKVFSTTVFSPSSVTGTGYLYISTTKTNAPSDIYLISPVLKYKLS